MRVTRRSPLPSVVTVIAAITLSLIGCGVSGKTGDSAAPDLNSPGTATPRTPQMPKTFVPGTAGPPATATPRTVPTTEFSTSEPDTTEPGSTPGTSRVPFNPGDLRKTYLGILKRAGLSDKEANCVVKLIFKNTNRPTDPGSTDFTKLGAGYLKCLGPDGVPGGD